MKGGKLSSSKENRFPHGLTILQEALKEHLGIQTNENNNYSSLNRLLIFLLDIRRINPYLPINKVNKVSNLASDRLCDKTIPHNPHNNLRDRFFMRV